MPLELYAMLLTVLLQFGLLEKCCSVVYTSLKIMHAANGACCMTLMRLVIEAAGCMPHATNQFFMKPPKLLQA
jgi:hypothetical protein